MQYDLSRLGEVVRALRIAKGLTQQAVANEAKLAIRYVSDIESGKTRSPSIQTILRLAEVLAGDSVDALLAATFPDPTERQAIAGQLRTQAKLGHMNKGTMRRAADMLDGGIA